MHKREAIFVAEFEPVTGRRTRRESRAAAALEVQVSVAGGGRALCRILDFSAHGVRLQTYSELQQGDMIWLTLPGAGRCSARVVWARDFEAGLEFKTPLSSKALEAIRAR